VTILVSIILIVVFVGMVALLPITLGKAEISPDLHYYFEKFTSKVKIKKRHKDLNGKPFSTYFNLDIFNI
jgi:hypothetical protein